MSKYCAIRISKKKKLINLRESQKGYIGRVWRNEREARYVVIILYFQKYLFLFSPYIKLESYVCNFQCNLEAI